MNTLSNFPGILYGVLALATALRVRNMHQPRPILLGYVVLAGVFIGECLSSRGLRATCPLMCRRRVPRVASARHTPLLCLPAWRRRVLRSNVRMALALALVLSGSSAFHATLTYTGQLLDELPMIYGQWHCAP
jgi:hypothetical protein